MEEQGRAASSRALAPADNAPAAPPQGSAVPPDATVDPTTRGLRPHAAVGRGFTQAGEMTWLLAMLAKDAVRRPRGYWGDVRDQMYAVLKLCWVPMVISCFAFGLGAPGLQALNFHTLFGVPERLGSFFIMASVREFAPWIDAMVVAGVVGTAITADLGARKIREELDALEVLGVDSIRTLVLPRVIALTVMTGLLDILALLVGVAGGFVAAVSVGGATPAAFVDNFFDNATVVDLVASVVKTSVFGLIIGVVCCYKGLRVQGGPAGVGRAVNQAVVISFAGVWIFNYVFTTILLGLNPGMLVFK